MFFVSVDPKEVSMPISHLFSTLTRRSAIVDSKGVQVILIAMLLGSTLPWK